MARLLKKVDWLVSRVNCLTCAITSVGGTELSLGTIDANTIGITSDGSVNDVIIPAATVTTAGLLTTAKWGEIVANTSKVSNITTDLSLGFRSATTMNVNSSDGTDATLVEADITDAGLLGAAKWAEIVANTSKVSNVTHTGEVTGSGVLTADTTIITNKTTVTGVTGDLVLIADASDSFNLKKVNLSDLLGEGVTSLNTLTDATQTFAVGTAGTNFAISSAAGVHTFNLPDAGTGITRGVVTNIAQTIDGAKLFNKYVTTPEYFNVSSVAADWKTHGYKSSGEWLIRGVGGSILNQVIGNNAPYTLLTGVRNLLWGRDSGTALTSGTGNILLGGDSTGSSLTTGWHNIAVGIGALANNVSSSSIVAIGYNAFGNLNVAGSHYSIAIGHDTGKGNTTSFKAFRSICIGYSSGLFAQDWSGTVAIGDQAGYRLEKSSVCTLIGYGIQFGVLTGTTTQVGNTFIGAYVAGSYTGSYNTFMGQEAGGGTSSGNYNTYIGLRAGKDSGSVSNKLVISCHLTNTLITGDGKTKIFAVDGVIQVGTGTATLAAGQIKYATSSLQAFTDRGYWQTLDKPILDISAVYTTLITDETINCTSGTFTVTLITAVGKRGKEYLIKNSGAGVITVDGNASETIDGDTTKSLATQYEWIRIKSDNANWIVIGIG